MGVIINPYVFAAVAPDFEDDFTTNNYTNVGTGVGVSGGLMQFIAAAGGDNRSHRSMGITLSDTVWVSDFDYRRASTTTGNIPSYAVIFVAGSSDPISLDFLGMRVDTGGDVYGSRRDGATEGTSTPITISNNTQYYVRVARTSATNLDISIFSNSTRTTHITGSPQSLTIPSTIVSLTHVQHAMKSNQSGDSYDARVDNLKVWNNVSTPP